MFRRTVWNKWTALTLLTLVGVVCAVQLVAVCEEYLSGKVWAEPKIIDPGPAGGVPSDAIVLFDGKSLSKWEGGNQWIIKDGAATSNGGGITTKQPFGDCQLHVEFATPSEVKGSSQGRGNSGVYLMNNYEVQILDSYDNKTYFDGQCASIYKQNPPLVNVCRKPGEWQSYDIVFHGPRFDAAGKLKKPGTVTVLQNGVLVQDHFEILGTSAWDAPPKYTAHPEKLPLQLQFHGNPVRFRNIWIREL
ncbi:MAG: 3-keto-disaccharide hydrolase [Pirellulales bacterium]